MICHRTIGPGLPIVVEGDGDPTGKWVHPPPRECIGSRCAAWVTHIDGSPRGWCGLVPDPAGFGVASMFPDPAADRDGYEAT